ncbi:MAG: ADP-ribosylglycohydrolase family protein, partial [Micrococcales bacterium]|nr:ADP-ribosylglycohydrolase family protein [Micrococcales bacterium]
YGARFRHWLVMDTPKPYDSCGNGSAMRVAAVGWLCHSPEQVCRWASVTARVTHNHPEGIKGAAATALAIYLARTGATKAQIKAQIEKRFDYDLSRSLDQIRPGYRRFETCQATVPEAITAFLESTGFEDTVRLAVSLGGDSDTLAAIAGSIAQAAYGIPSDLVDQARRRLDQPLLEVIEAFDQVVSDAPQPPVI